MSASVSVVVRSASDRIKRVWNYGRQWRAWPTPEGGVIDQIFDVFMST
jgi:thymidylate synthase